MTLTSLPPPLNQTYDVLDVLGEGGFGTVLRVRHRQSGTEAALKLLKQEMADQEMRRRFERESKVTVKLRHPHVVTILDAGVTPGGQAYILYEFVQGRDLESVRGLSEESLAEIGAAISEALHVAHQLGIIHRDLKPANILLREDGSPVLCDFGVARTSGSGTVVTATGILLGTPEFMAPELWRGKPATAASDQWAWAATLYECLYGRGVLPKADVTTIMRAALKGPPPAFPNLAGGPPAILAGPLARALASDPQERFPDMAQFAQSLRESLRNPGSQQFYASSAVTQKLAAPSSGRWDAMGSVLAPKAGSLPPQSRWRVLAMGATVLLISLGLFSYLTSGVSSPPPTSRPRIVSTTEPQSPKTPPEAVREARRNLDRALTSLQEFFPPPGPGEPIYMTHRQRADYLDTLIPGPEGERPRAKALIASDFLSCWENTVQAYQTWLFRVSAWHEAFPEVPVVELPGVRGVMIEVGLQELRRVMEHLWLVCHPALQSLDRTLPTERMGIKISAEVKDFFFPIQDLIETLRSPPFRDQTLAVVSADWLSILEDLSRIGERIEGWMDRIGSDPLNADRAWMALLALRSMEGDWGGHTTRCEAYRAFAIRLEEPLMQTTPLQDGPTMANLWASYLAFTWKLGTDRRCEDAYRDEILPKLIDRQLDMIEGLFTEEHRLIGRLLESMKQGPAPDREAYKDFPQALRDRYPKVQSFIHRNRDIQGLAPLPEEPKTSLFIR